jgi:hypothetical protein
MKRRDLIHRCIRPVVSLAGARFTVPSKVTTARELPQGCEPRAEAVRRCRVIQNARLPAIGPGVFVGSPSHHLPGLNKPGAVTVRSKPANSLAREQQR